MNFESQGGESLASSRTNTPFLPSLSCAGCKGVLEIIQPKPPAKARSPRAGLILAVLVGFDSTVLLTGTDLLVILMLVLMKIPSCSGVFQK